MLVSFGVDAQKGYRVGLRTRILLIASRVCLENSKYEGRPLFTSIPLIPSRVSADIFGVFKITGRDYTEIVNQVVCVSQIRHALLNASFQRKQSILSDHG